MKRNAQKAMHIQPPEGNKLLPLPEGLSNELERVLWARTPLNRGTPAVQGITTSFSENHAKVKIRFDLWNRSIAANLKELFPIVPPLPYVDQREASWHIAYARSATEQPVWDYIVPFTLFKARTEQRNPEVVTLDLVRKPSEVRRIAGYFASWNKEDTRTPEPLYINL
jgi:hypothetical protein